MKTQELETTIASFINSPVEARMNLLILGQPGMGKSEIVKAAVARAGMDLITINGAICDPLDAKGALWVDPETKKASFQPIGANADIINATKPTVVNLDDLTQTAPSMQAAFMQVVQDRRIGDHPVPDCVRFVATGNRAQDRSGVVQMIEALKDRFTIIEAHPDHLAWCAWATTAGLRAEIISYVAKMNGENFCDFDPKRGMAQSPSARGFERCSHLLDMGLPISAQRECFVGAVGEGVAAELNGHLAMWDSLPDWNEVMDDPDGCDIPKESNVQFALGNALMRAVLDDDPRYDAAFRYAERLCEKGCHEMATFMAQTITMVDARTEQNTGTNPGHCQGAAFIRLATGPLQHLIHD